MAETLASLSSYLQGLVPAHVVPTLAAVGLAESNRGTAIAGDAVASGSTPYQCRGYSSWGIWQIHLPAHTALLHHLTGSLDPCVWASWLSVPSNSALAAASVYHGSGLGAWTTYVQGSYAPYLSASSSVPGGNVSAPLTLRQRLAKWLASYWGWTSQASSPSPTGSGVPGAPRAVAHAPAKHYGIPSGGVSSLAVKLVVSLVAVGLILSGVVMAGLGVARQSPIGRVVGGGAE